MSSVSQRLGAILLAVTAQVAGGQDTVDQRVMLGPWAGIFWSPVSVSVNDGDASTVGGTGISFGVALRPLARLGGSGVLAGELRRLRLTPHLGLTASHFRGIDPEIDSIAFSEFSLFGIRVTWDATDRFHVFGITRYGKRNAELSRRSGGAFDVDNVWGNATTNGLGAGLTMTRGGRGIEVAVLTSRGAFTRREVVDRVTNEHVGDEPVHIPFRALWVQVGWSGPFTGASWPWR